MKRICDSSEVFLNNHISRRTFAVLAASIASATNIDIYYSIVHFMQPEAEANIQDTPPPDPPHRTFSHPRQYGLLHDDSPSLPSSPAGGDGDATHSGSEWSRSSSTTELADDRWVNKTNNPGYEETAVDDNDIQVTTSRSVVTKTRADKSPFQDVPEGMISSQNLLQRLALKLRQSCSFMSSRIYRQTTC